jgi:hypothetical protein
MSPLEPHVLYVSAMFVFIVVRIQVLFVCLELLLALSSLTSGGRSVGIVRLRTTATEFSFSLVLELLSLFINAKYAYCLNYVRL